MEWAIILAIVAFMCLLIHRPRAESFAQALDPSTIPAFVISMRGVRNARSRGDIVKRMKSTVPNLKFFDGIDGASQPPVADLKPGEIGCAWSHIRLWEQETGANVPFLVFEDDAMPVKDFKRRLNHVLQHLDETIDMVFLGHCFEHAHKEYAPGLMVSERPRCTHGYLVTPRGVRKLVEWARTEQFTIPIDEELARMISDGKLRALSCDPPCVGTTGAKSVIKSMGA